jgi:hypothetical protein
MRRSVLEMLVCVVGLGAAVGAAACTPPAAIYDLAATGGGATTSHTTGSGGASTSTDACAGTGTGSCGEGSIAGLVGDFKSAADWGTFANQGTTVTPQEGRVVMTTDGTPGRYAGCYDTASVLASGCQVFVHVTPTEAYGPYTTFMALDGQGTGDTIQMVKVGGVLQMDVQTGAASSSSSSGSTSSAGYQQSVPYDAFAHAWWRIREAQGTLYFETSSDGKCWTEQGHATTPTFAGSVRVNFGLGVPSGSGRLTMDQATFDHLNSLL